jgi:endonuclease YncB( thermonuclease family)
MLFFACLWAATIQTNAENIEGRVVSIADGDTITVLTSDKKQIKTRLDSIDAPEKKMLFGNVAKKAFSDLVYNKQVILETHKTDRYKRKVAIVWLDGKPVNLEMVNLGMAWVYRKYARDPAYYAAETVAKANKLGLWSQSDPQPPWEFRHPDITQAVPKSNLLLVSGTTNSSFTCGGKRYCKQMISRDEANFYLTQCGVKSLDRDNDGQACESLN